MFKLYFREQAARRLSKIDEPYFSLIRKELSILDHNYFPGGKNCKRLLGSPYRALYHVDHKKKIITILRVFHRSEGYE